MARSSRSDGTKTGLDAIRRASGSGDANGVTTLEHTTAVDTLRGEDFVPSEQFKEIRMLEPPVRGPLRRGDMLIGYVFDGQLEQFAEGVVAPTMPISGPIFYEAIVEVAATYYGGRCAGCREQSKTYTSTAHDKDILRWAREHRCFRRRELDIVVR